MIIFIIIIIIIVVIIAANVMQYLISIEAVNLQK